MNRERLRVRVRGAVQGVGFRPFVYRLAHELGLSGWVSNSAQGVSIEVEGGHDQLKSFRLRLEREKPARALVQSLESSFLDAVAYEGFVIRESDDRGGKSAFILPDIATCQDCLREIFDPSNRRFRYPFTNCTHCGPRFSIIEALPYDRANTSMRTFAMCRECRAEYENPLDRRFHAQPNACLKCGPQLKLWDAPGNVVAEKNDALLQAANVIRDGRILALKGLGGFQLVADARNDEAVLRLRERKHREEKPFALMYPDLESVRADCEVSELEERMLGSPESPIVLLNRPSTIENRKSKIAPSVAPRNPNLGVMLPYSPLHHLVMAELAFPVVATSGNLSDEPICIEEAEVLRRLGGIADAFLLHDRPIVRHVDDSIARVMCGRELVLRRARGYAPLPIVIKTKIENRDSKIVLTLGAHLKNTVALRIDDNIFVSQHIGDLETSEAYEASRRAATDLPRLYEVQADTIACDLHPDYLSTRHAHELIASLPDKKRPRLIQVQHHWAHVLACMAENEIDPPVLGVSWDGTGYGLDGTIWGGEFLLSQANSFERVAHLRPFRLPGGDASVKEPRRTALGVLHEIFGKELWQQKLPQFDLSSEERTMFSQMLGKGIHAPLTSSMGRLFDAVTALAGIRQRSFFEGQAAMELEFLRQRGERDAYFFIVENTSPAIINWEPVIREILADVASKTPPALISAKFHNGVIEMLVAVAKRIGQGKVVLTGGCFQNRYLTERAVARLREEQFRPYWHQRVPPNDGGISLGQAVAAAWGTESK